MGTEKESTETVILRDSETWNRWITLIQLQAEEEEVWDLIDPSGTFDEATPFPPVCPAKPDYDAIFIPPAPTPPDAGVVSDTPAQDTPVSGSPGLPPPPPHLRLLTPLEKEQAQRRYEEAKEDYNKDLKEWKAQMKGIRRVHTTIVKTTGTWFRNIEKVRSVRDCLLQLKELVEPIDLAQKREVAEAYDKLIQKGVKNSRFMEWADEVEVVLRQAEAFDLGLLKDMKPFQDIIIGSVASPGDNGATDATIALATEPRPSTPPMPAVFQIAHRTYPLRDSTILISGSSDHVTNNLSYFVQGSYEECRPREIYSGTQIVRIVGYGRRLVPIDTDSHDQEYLELKRVAYIPGFHVSVVSHDLLREAGYYWHGGANQILEIASNAFICRLSRHHRQSVIEHKPLRKMRTQTQPFPLVPEA